MDNSVNKQNTIKKEHSSILFLIVFLVAITLVYQLRPFLNDSQFFWISFPSYVIVPGILIVFSIILTIKLYKQKHFQSKAFLFFTIGVSFWFIAEQIWAVYQYVYDVDPFPSTADIFYMASYPFFVAFLLISIKPIRKSITKKIWLFSFVLSFAFLIPSLFACFNALEETEGGLDIVSKSIALAYPILSSFQLAPAIIGIMFLTKKEVNYSWMLLLFGFLIFIVSDTFYLFSTLNGSYYDGHPVDLMYLYGFILLIFSLHSRLKLANNSNDKNQEIFFSENIKFETINKLGIPLVLIIFCMIVVISLVSVTYSNSAKGLSVDNLMFGIMAMLVVFTVIILTINKSLTQFVKMRTKELEEQRNNLEYLIEEKTQAVLKAERLSAIGELSGRLAHDLRNPLSVMKMSIDLIKQHPADAKISDSIITKRLVLIEKSIERISHQIDDVLDYVRNSPLKLSLTPLRTIILGSIDKIHVPHDVAITVSDSDVTVNCDLVKVDAVFINLIVNAIQAMPQGGTIEINIKSDCDNVVIEFIDSGIGVPEEFVDKIFEPLFTTKQKGTGLGLASCKNIIEQHNGKISVKNNPTTFTIRFPKTIS
ncbi:MAG: GHKL domain-containing protein [Nitrosopumilaceae archaeon]|nr:MAG: GHKL domain-containing protein [Nitrosopumilaceae archaeon]